MLDALLVASLTIVSHVFPTLIGDFFKRLSKKNNRSIPYSRS